MDCKLREVGPSCESRSSSHRDLNRRVSEEVDRSKVEEKVETLEELQNSLSRFEKEMKRKNTKPANWKPADLKTHQELEKRYHENVEKLKQIEQWLPELVSRPEAKNAIRDINSMKYYRINAITLLDMYQIIKSIHNDMKQLFPDIPDSSGSKGNDTMGQGTTSS